MPAQQGVSLIEVLVTLVIGTIGLLGLSSLLLQSNQVIFDIGNRSQAIWIVEDIISSMRANLDGFSGYVTTGLDCSSTAPKICSAYHNGVVSIPAASDCNSIELAQSDVYQSLCGLPVSVVQSDVSFSGAADFINAPKLTIKLDVHALSGTIEISWEVRTRGQTNLGDTLYARDKNLLKNTVLRDKLMREVQL